MKAILDTALTLLRIIVKCVVVFYAFLIALIVSIARRR